MIGHLANLTRWEWFKLRSRRMPWILLTILVLFTQLFIWGNFFAYLNSRGAEEQFTMGRGGSGEPPIVVTVVCRDLLQGELPELPPNTDPRIYERIEDFCERVEHGVSRKSSGRCGATSRFPGAFPTP